LPKGRCAELLGGAKPKPKYEKEVEAFRSLHTAYTMVYPAYPKAFGRIISIQDEADFLRSTKPEGKAERRKKRERTEQLDLEWKKYENEGWMKKAFECSKQLPSGRLEKSKEAGLTHVSSWTPESVLKDMGLELKLESIGMLMRDFYSVEEIKAVLRKYGGEALLDQNMDIMMLNIAMRFVPARMPDLAERMPRTGGIFGADFIK
jgi:hypothetical protein